MPRGKKSAIDKSELKRLILNGKSMHEAGVILGVTYSAVKYMSERMIAAGELPPFRKEVRKVDAAKVKELTLQGKTINEICEITQFRYNAVRNHVQKMRQNGGLPKKVLKKDLEPKRKKKVLHRVVYEPLQPIAHIDTGKILALHNAGWDVYQIAREMAAPIGQISSVISTEGETDDETNRS